MAASAASAVAAPARTATTDVAHQLELVPAGEAGAELRVEHDGSLIRRSVLPGGIRVLTERMPAQRSATIGAWVAVGSRDETDGHHGSTHFLEHLLFKGTPARNAMDIAAAFDAVGGEANAATGKEFTCYFARVMGKDLAMAVEVILDMVTSARLAPEDFETERGVILEELAMASDDPVDVAHEQIFATVLGSHPLGRPIGGTPESIRAVSRDAVWEHYQHTYRPDELVITAAGAVDHDALCELVAAAVRRGGWEIDPHRAPAARRDPIGELPDAAEGRALTVRRSTEQANVILGAPGIVATAEERWPMAVLMTALGGGMSSRLFQEIRERRGLAYTTYAFASSYAEAGLVGLYAGCNPTKVSEVVAVLAEEFAAMAAAPLEAEELDRARGQLAGGLVLGLEDTSSRMSRLGRAEITYGRLTSIEESLARIRAVSATDVQELAARLVARPRSLVIVGPFTDDVAGEALGA